MAAANELHVTQGAVAQHVRKLENELGVVLFTREPRGLKFTERGGRYHKAVSRVFRDIDVATRALAPKQVGLRITLPAALASRWLLARLGMVRHCIEGRTIALNVSGGEASLLNGETDVLIHHGEAPNGSNLYVESLGSEDLVAVAAASVFENVGLVADLMDLQAHTLLDDDHYRWRAYVDESATILELGQAALALNAAEEGQGIALVPHLLAMDAIAAGRLHILWRDPQTSDRGFYLVSILNQAKELEKLARFLVQEARTA